MLEQEELYIRQFTIVNKLASGLILTHNELKRIENVIDQAETRTRMIHRMEDEDNG